MDNNIILELAALIDEPIIPHENEKLFEDILKIERTAQFVEMDISEEKLDELLENLKTQEDFVLSTSDINDSLERVPSIIIINNDDDEDFI